MAGAGEPGGEAAGDKKGAEEDEGDAAASAAVDTDSRGGDTNTEEEDTDEEEEVDPDLVNESNYCFVCQTSKHSTTECSEAKKRQEEAMAAEAAAAATASPKASSSSAAATSSSSPAPPSAAVAGSEKSQESPLKVDGKLPRWQRRVEILQSSLPPTKSPSSSSLPRRRENEGGSQRLRGSRSKSRDRGTAPHRSSRSSRSSSRDRHYRRRSDSRKSPRSRSRTRSRERRHRREHHNQDIRRRAEERRDREGHSSSSSPRDRRTRRRSERSTSSPRSSGREGRVSGKSDSDSRQPPSDSTRSSGSRRSPSKDHSSFGNYRQKSPRPSYPPGRRRRRRSRGKNEASEDDSASDSGTSLSSSNSSYQADDPTPAAIAEKTGVPPPPAAADGEQRTAEEAGASGDCRRPSPTEGLQRDEQRMPKHKTKTRSPSPADGPGALGSERRSRSRPRSLSPRTPPPRHHHSPPRHHYSPPRHHHSPPRHLHHSPPRHHHRRSWSPPPSYPYPPPPPGGMRHPRSPRGSRSPPPGYYSPRAPPPRRARSRSPPRYCYDDHGYRMRRRTPPSPYSYHHRYQHGRRTPSPLRRRSRSRSRSPPYRRSPGPSRHYQSSYRRSRTPPPPPPGYVGPGAMGYGAPTPPRPLMSHPPPHPVPVFQPMPPRHQRPPPVIVDLRRESSLVTIDPRAPGPSFATAPPPTAAVAPAVPGGPPPLMASDPRIIHRTPPSLLPCAPSGVAPPGAIASAALQVAPPANVPVAAPPPMGTAQAPMPPAAAASTVGQTFSAAASTVGQTFSAAAPLKIPMGSTEPILSTSDQPPPPIANLPPGVIVPLATSTGLTNDDLEPDVQQQQQSQPASQPQVPEPSLSDALLPSGGAPSLLRLRPMDSLRMSALTSAAMPENIISSPDVEVSGGSAAPRSISSTVILSHRADLKGMDLASFMQKVVGKDVAYELEQTTEGKKLRFKTPAMAVKLMNNTGWASGTCKYGEAVRDVQGGEIKRYCLEKCFFQPEVDMHTRSGYPRRSAVIRVILGTLTADLTYKEESTTVGMRRKMSKASFGFADVVTSWGDSGAGGAEGSRESSKEFLLSMISTFKSTLKMSSAQNMFDTGMICFESLKVAQAFLEWAQGLGLVEQLLEVVGYVGVVPASGAESFNIREDDSAERGALLFSNIYNDIRSKHFSFQAFMKSLSVPSDRDLVQKFGWLAFVEAKYERLSSTGEYVVRQLGAVFVRPGDSDREFHCQLPMENNNAKFNGANLVQVSSEEMLFTAFLNFLSFSKMPVVAFSYSSRTLFPLLLASLKKHDLLVQFHKILLGYFDMEDLLRDAGVAEFSWKEEVYGRHLPLTTKDDLDKCKNYALVGAKLLRSVGESVEKDLLLSYTKFIRTPETLRLPPVSSSCKVPLRITQTWTRTLLPGQRERITLDLPSTSDAGKGSGEEECLFVRPSFRAVVEVKEVTDDKVSLILSNQTGTTVLLDDYLGFAMRTSFCPSMAEWLEASTTSQCSIDMPYKLLPLKAPDNGKGAVDAFPRDIGDIAAKDSDYEKLITTLTEGSETPRFEAQKETFNPATVQDQMTVCLLSLKRERKDEEMGGRLYQVCLTDLETRQDHLVNVWPKSSGSFGEVCRLLGYHSTFEKHGTVQLHPKMYRHRTSHHMLPANCLSQAMALSSVLLDGFKKVVICYNAVAVAHAVSKICKENPCALGKIVAFIDLEWCLPPHLRTDRRMSWTEMMTAVLGPDAEVPLPFETDDINRVSAQFIDKVFQGRKAFLKTTKFISTFAVDWGQLLPFGQNRNARIVLKTERKGAVGGGSMASRLAPERQAMRSLKEVATAMQQREALSTAPQPTAAASTSPRAEPLATASLETHTPTETTETSPPLAASTTPAQDPTPASMPPRPASASSMASSLNSSEASSSRTPQYQDQDPHSVAAQAALRQIEQEKRRRRERRRREESRQREEQERQRRRSLQTAVVHVGMGRLVTGRDFVDSLAIYLPAPPGVEGDGNRFSAEAIVPAAKDGGPLPQEILAPAGFSYRGCDHWMRSQGCRIVNAIQEKEAVDKAVKFLIDHQRDSLHSYELVLLTCDVAERLEELFRRHASDRWLVLKSLVAGFVDLSNAAVARSLSKTRDRHGDPKRAVFRHLPHHAGRLEQALRITYGRRYQKEAAAALDASDKVTAMWKMELELDSYNSRWHNWRFAEEIDKKYNLVLLHVDTMPSKTGQTEVAAFSIRTPFNEKQVEILQYDMEFVCPVAPADGCFHPEVLERHRLRRNSKGTWEYRCPGKEKAKKCWKAKEGVEWFIRKVLHESLNRKAVLCYLDFYDVLVPFLRLVTRANLESELSDGVCGMLDLSDAFRRTDVINPRSEKSAMEQIMNYAESREGDGDDGIEVLESTTRHSTTVVKLCEKAVLRAGVALSNPDVSSLVERPCSTAFLRRLAARTDVSDFKEDTFEVRLKNLRVLSSEPSSDSSVPVEAECQLVGGFLPRGSEEEVEFLLKSSELLPSTVALASMTCKVLRSEVKHMVPVTAVKLRIKSPSPSTALTTGDLLGSATPLEAVRKALSEGTMKGSSFRGMDVASKALLVKDIRVTKEELARISGLDSEPYLNFRPLVETMFRLYKFQGLALPYKATESMLPTLCSDFNSDLEGLKEVVEKSISSRGAAAFTIDALKSTLEEDMYQIQQRDFLLSDEQIELFLEATLVHFYRMGALPDRCSPDGGGTRLESTANEELLDISISDEEADRANNSGGSANKEIGKRARTNAGVTEEDLIVLDDDDPPPPQPREEVRRPERSPTTQTQQEILAVLEGDTRTTSSSEADKSQEVLAGSRAREYPVGIRKKKRKDNEVQATGEQSQQETGDPPPTKEAPPMSANTPATPSPVSASSSSAAVAAPAAKETTPQEAAKSKKRKRPPERGDEIAVNPESTATKRKKAVRRVMTASPEGGGRRGSRVSSELEEGEIRDPSPPAKKGTDKRSKEVKKPPASKKDTPSSGSRRELDGGMGKEKKKSTDKEKASTSSKDRQRKRSPSKDSKKDEEKQSSSQDPKKIAERKKSPSKESSRKTSSKTSKDSKKNKPTDSGSKQERRDISKDMSGKKKKTVVSPEPSSAAEPSKGTKSKTDSEEENTTVDDSFVSQTTEEDACAERQEENPENDVMFEEELPDPHPVSVSNTPETKSKSTKSVKSSSKDDSPNATESNKTTQEGSTDKENPRSEAAEIGQGAGTSTEKEIKTTSGLEERLPEKTDQGVTNVKAGESLQVQKETESGTYDKSSEDASTLPEKEGTANSGASDADVAADVDTEATTEDAPSESPEEAETSIPHPEFSPLSSPPPPPPPPPPEELPFDPDEEDIGDFRASVVVTVSDDEGGALLFDINTSSFMVLKTESMYPSPCELKPGDPVLALKNGSSQDVDGDDVELGVPLSMWTRFPDCHRAVVECHSDMRGKTVVAFRDGDGTKALAIVPEEKLVSFAKGDEPHPGDELMDSVGEEVLVHTVERKRQGKMGFKYRMTLCVRSSNLSRYAVCSAAASSAAEVEKVSEFFCSKPGRRTLEIWHSEKRREGNGLPVVLCDVDADGAHLDIGRTALSWSRFALHKVTLERKDGEERFSALEREDGEEHQVIVDKWESRVLVCHSKEKIEACEVETILREKNLVPAPPEEKKLEKKDDQDKGEIAKEDDASGSPSPPSKATGSLPQNISAATTAAEAAATAPTQSTTPVEEEAKQTSSGNSPTKSLKQRAPPTATTAKSPKRTSSAEQQTAVSSPKRATPLNAPASVAATTPPQESPTEATPATPPKSRPPRRITAPSPPEVKEEEEKPSPASLNSNRLEELKGEICIKHLRGSCNLDPSSCHREHGPPKEMGLRYCASFARSGSCRNPKCEKEHLAPTFLNRSYQTWKGRWRLSPYDPPPRYEPPGPPDSDDDYGCPPHDCPHLSYPWKCQQLCLNTMRVAACKFGANCFNAHKVPDLLAHCPEFLATRTCGQWVRCQLPHRTPLQVNQEYIWRRRQMTAECRDCVKQEEEEEEEGGESQWQPPPPKRSRVRREDLQGPSTSSGPQGRRNIRPCRYFPLGNCKNGDRCGFAHVYPPGMEEEEEVPMQEPLLPQPPALMENPVPLPETYDVLLCNDLYLRPDSFAVVQCAVDPGPGDRSLAGANVDVEQYHGGGQGDDDGAAPPSSWHVSHAPGRTVEAGNTISVKINNVGGARAAVRLRRGTAVAVATNVRFM